MLRHLIAMFGRASSGTPSARRRNVRPGCEVLEERAVPAFFASEFQPVVAASAAPSLAAETAAVSSIIRTQVLKNAPTNPLVGTGSFVRICFRPLLGNGLMYPILVPPDQVAAFVARGDIVLDGTPGRTLADCPVPEIVGSLTTANPTTVAAASSLSAGGSTQFVDTVYQLVLNRHATAAEDLYWNSVRAGPGGAAAVVAAISQSREALTVEVQNLYAIAFGRVPVRGEEQGWVDQLQQGNTVEDVLAQLFASSEFAARAGGTDTAFLQQLFESALNRAATADELQAWSAVLATSGRAGVALDILHSAEFRGDTVALYYQTLFQRMATASELSYWANSSTDLESLRQTLEASTEFQALHPD